MARKISFAPDEFYHLYNRGNDKRLIFKSERDQERFMKLLYLCNGQNPFHFFYLERTREYEFNRGNPLLEIISYCLMDNHFHILVKEKKDGGISNFMHRGLTSYTMYFNKLNDRKGRLFETNFQARHIDSDEYLQYVHAYIHLNPVKIIEPKWKDIGLKNIPKAKQFLNSYCYSSYLDWQGRERVENKIISKDAYPHFDTRKELDDYIQNWLIYSNEA